MMPLDVAKWQEDVRILDMDLDTAFREQASLYAFYAHEYYEAMKLASTKKVKLDITYAQLDKRIRDRVNEENAAAAAAMDPDDKKAKPAVVKLTEAQVEAEINRSADYVRAKRDVIEADAMLELCRSVLESFRQRRDMLIQLGANEREERKGELRMKEHPATGHSSALRAVGDAMRA